MSLHRNFAAKVPLKQNVWLPAHLPLSLMMLTEKQQSKSRHSCAIIQHAAFAGYPKLSESLLSNLEYYEVILNT